MREDLSLHLLLEPVVRKFERDIFRMIDEAGRAPAGLITGNGPYFTMGTTTCGGAASTSNTLGMDDWLAIIRDNRRRSSH